MAMKDSGERRAFATGAVRDAAVGKPRPELISPIATERLAAWLARGASKYEARNWEKGIPLSVSLGSLMRHLGKIQMHRRDEDHFAAAYCNVMFLLHTDAMIRVGLLPKELNDLPWYRFRKTRRKSTKETKWQKDRSSRQRRRAQAR